MDKGTCPGRKKRVFEFDGLTDQQITAIQKSRRRVIESIGKNMDLYGVTLSIGHLYGNMFFYSRPVTLDQMAETMGMSKTSISTGMRTLMDLKMVSKVWEKGSRKDLYEVVPDWYQNFIDYFNIKWRKAAEMNAGALKKSLQELEELREADPFNENLRELLIREALAYYNWLERLIDAFESGEIFEFIPKEQD
jgi:DNA-binding transcriptional regulator GbsR (MarR family)